MVQSVETAPESAKTAPLPSTTILKSALSAGAITGVSGVAFGSFVGVLKSAHPVFFAIMSGAQWFTLGATFWGSRTLILNVTEAGERGHSFAPATTFAGATSGGLTGALFRGRRNIFPGALVFGILGLSGQHLYDMAHKSNSTSFGSNAPVKDESDLSPWQRLISSKWSPVKVLSDEEYSRILSEKLIVVEAEIATIDEELKQLKDRKDGSQH